MRRHESGGSGRRYSKTDRRCGRNFPEADLKEKRGMVIKKGRNRCRKLRGEGIRAKRDYGVGKAAMGHSQMRRPEGAEMGMGALEKKPFSFASTGYILCPFSWHFTGSFVR